ncbi:MAG: HAMP domain-containing protein [Burkholderiaceae bacterium]|nr:HAMP domain-containing protein [Burkholderiaceae bacterium]
MRYSLNRITSASFGAFFLGVLVIGSVSVWHSQKMLERTLEIAEESAEVDEINEIRHKTNMFISALRIGVATKDPADAQQAIALADEIKEEIATYLERNHFADDPDVVEEVRLLLSVRNDLHSMQQVARQANASPASTVALLERHTRTIDARVRHVNELHFKMIGEEVASVHDSMVLIRNLYLVFALTGLATIYIGYRVHARRVVIPVRKLQEAAERVANGDLGVRVESDSGTEIGALYRAFNRMIEQLQSNDRQRARFNDMLEQKVRERTLALEHSHETLRETQGELLRVEHLALLGQIAAAVNHEVRTPLNSLYMNVQLIRRGLERNRATVHTERRVAQRSALERIALVEREVVRISDMLEEFVNYARLQPPVLTDLDPNRPIRHVAQMLAERAERAGVTLHLALADPAPAVRGDDDKLVQVLVNLCTNAIQAMPAGGALSVDSSVETDAFTITVADTGGGIPAENLDRLFKPFFTTKKDGLGFGLAIVRRIIEQHGGRIDVQSQPGVGTVFTIRLPLAAAA